MNTREYETKISSIVKALRTTILRLVLHMERGEDNKGNQFKINNSVSRRGTIAIRCNHVQIRTVPKYIKHVISELALKESFPLLELISINKSYEIDSTTQRKRAVPSHRTIFITFRPPREVYDKLLERLPAAGENYMRITDLLNTLEKLE